MVIPYRSVLQFYFKEAEYLRDTEEEQQRQAMKRKHGPVSEQRRRALIAQLEKARATRSAMLEKQG